MEDCTIEGRMYLGNGNLEKRWKTVWREKKNGILLYYM